MVGTSIKGLDFYDNTCSLHGREKRHDPMIMEWCYIAHPQKQPIQWEPKGKHHEEKVAEKTTAAKRRIDWDEESIKIKDKSMKDESAATGHPNRKAASSSSSQTVPASSSVIKVSLTPTSSYTSGSSDKSDDSSDSKHADEEILKSKEANRASEENEHKDASGASKHANDKNSKSEEGDQHQQQKEQ